MGERRSLQCRPASSRLHRSARNSIGAWFALAALACSALAAASEGAFHPFDEPIKPLPPLQAFDAKKLALGEQLFGDRRLSGDNSVACTSCHDLQANGASRRARDSGMAGKTVLRNTPTVFNSALNFRQFWDGRVATPELLIADVLHNPAVMRSTWADVLRKLRADPATVGRFQAVYPDGVQQDNVTDALATFVRSLGTPNARMDRYLLGDTAALTADELRGYQLFKSYGCVACHQGANVGGNMFQIVGVVKRHGEYFSSKSGGPTDFGRYAVTKLEADKFVFRVPSLRNVAVTPPYFHDGSAQTLQEAVRVMFEYQLGRKPRSDDIELIVKFLGTLTGEYRGRSLHVQEDR